MKLHILGIALLAASATAIAQAQSGSAIGSNPGGSGSVSAPPRPLPQPLPSTGTSADTAGAQGTSPRTPETSVGTSGTVQTPDNIGRSSGRCDSLIGEERTKCLREQASTGTTGPSSTGMSPGATR